MLLCRWAYMSRALQTEDSPKGRLAYVDIERFKRVANGFHPDDRVMKVSSRQFRCVRKISKLERCVDQGSAFAWYKMSPEDKWKQSEEEAPGHGATGSMQEKEYNDATCHISSHEG